MESGQKKEEIIELTEVAEEGPPPSRGKELQASSPQVAIKKESAPPLSPPREASSPSLESTVRTLKAAMAGQAADWATKDGPRIIERMAQESIPRIAQSRLEPEIAKLRAELSALRSERETLAARVEPWFQKEGMERIERLIQTSVPKLVVDHLHPERERVQKEMEELRSRRESLSGEIERWLESEGARSLERSAGEIVPGIVGEKLRPEIEALTAELARVRLQAEDERVRILGWFEKEGREILEKTAREIFPRIAEDVLRQEIARLKEAAGDPEKE